MIFMRQNAGVCTLEIKACAAVLGLHARQNFPPSRRSTVLWVVCQSAEAAFHCLISSVLLQASQTLLRSAFTRVSMAIFTVIPLIEDCRWTIYRRTGSGKLDMIRQFFYNQRPRRDRRPWGSKCPHNRSGVKMNQGAGPRWRLNQRLRFLLPRPGHEHRGRLSGLLAAP